jgi:hypothetical protein
MTNITAIERGRSLQITVGEATEPDAIIITVKPLNTKLGTALYALWAGILFGQSEQPEIDSESMARMALGEENWEVLDELRWGETERVINAAFFWNVQGGSLEMVHTLLSEEAGGFPKAQELLLTANGHLDLFRQLTTLLSSDEGNATPSPDGTSGTSTPSGSGTVSRLPEAKRSIGQNAAKPHPAVSRRERRAAELTSAPSGATSSSTGTDTSSPI